MGFTINLFSGFTLTSTALYLSLLYHQRARTHQAALLHQQALLLNSLSDPDVASELATIADANYSGGLREGIKPYRVEKAPWTERWKDRWNSEVEGAVRYAQGIRFRTIPNGFGLQKGSQWNNGSPQRWKGERSAVWSTNPSSLHVLVFRRFAVRQGHSVLVVFLNT
ncbi:hypothetical protein BDR22DRAFT_824278 [Usnea florida]